MIENCGTSLSFSLSLIHQPTFSLSFVTSLGPSASVMTLIRPLQRASSLRCQVLLLCRFFFRSVSIFLTYTSYLQSVFFPYNVLYYCVLLSFLLFFSPLPLNLYFVSLFFLLPSSIHHSLVSLPFPLLPIKSLSSLLLPTPSSSLYRFFSLHLRPLPLLFSLSSHAQSSLHLFVLYHLPCSFKHMSGLLIFRPSLCWFPLNICPPTRPSRLPYLSLFLSPLLMFHYVYGLDKEEDTKSFKLPVST